MSTATQPIEITDEGPYPPEDPSDEPGSTVQPVLVDEDDIGTPAASDSRGLTIDFGPDGPADTGPVALEVPAALAGLGLTSGGTPLSYGVSPDGLTLSATAGGNPVFEVTLDDGGVGAWSYTFTLLDQVDHAPGLGENLITGIPFLVRITDGDGSSATAGFTAGIQDDLPALTPGATATVDEANLEFALQTDVFGVAAVPAGIVDASATFAFSAQTAPVGLTSQGDAVSYAVSGTSLVATAGGRTVFTVALDAVTGSYAFTLYDQLDHAAGADANLLSLAFGVTATDFDGDTVTTAFGIDIVDDLPATAPGFNPSVDEALLDGVSGTSITGIAALPTGIVDAPAEFAFADSQTGIFATHSAGDPITLAISASSIVATAGGRTVFTVALDAASGSYTFTLRDQIDHLPGAGANVTGLHFAVDLTDFDGDTVTANFAVDVVDDLPEPLAGSTATVLETDLESSSATTVTGIAATLDGVVDEAATFGFIGAPVGLLSAGEIVDVAVSATSIVGIAGGRTVFTVALDAASGSYTFTLLDQLDHAPADGENSLSLAFGVTVTDFDGDTEIAGFAVEVVDDIPAPVEGGAVTVDEAALDSSTAISVTGNAAGALGIVDAPPAAFGFSLGQSAPLGLESQGEEIQYTVVNAATLVAEANGRTVFTIQLDTVTGSYTFTLLDQIDHALGNEANLLSLGFAVDVVDFDGDAVATQFGVAIIDDVPVATSETPVSLSEDSATVSGNVLVNDDLGEDTPAIVSEFRYVDPFEAVQIAAAGSTVTTRYGTLTVNGDGTWTYTSSDADHSGGPVHDDFTYTLVDFDGDEVMAVQPIEITDEGPYPPEDPSDEPGSTVQPVLVDEDDIGTPAASDSRGLTIDFGPDGPADTGP
ncbi:MAG: DUF5801 repeats-in-toxin domain-containing protein, partial [Alphaproteobacteria bacterium]